MFFDSLKKVRSGMVVCVFDGPDRIQHMFWRFLEENHPALRGQKNTVMPIRSGICTCGWTISLDAPWRKSASETTLIVMSDHGFTSFQRGVDLNAWLLSLGYLKLKDGARSSNKIYLNEVDWSQHSGLRDWPGGDFYQRRRAVNRKAL